MVPQLPRPSVGQLPLASIILSTVGWTYLIDAQPLRTGRGPDRMEPNRFSAA